MDNTIIVGIDEAGRGPLAGPVVAAAVHLPSLPHKMRKGGWCIKQGRSMICRLFDSKQLSETERELSYAWIIQNCPHGICAASSHEVDTLGILGATELAMQRALAMLSRSITPTYLLVDGRDKFWFDVSHTSIIEGDSKEPCIAAASILAKVTRDRMMKRFDRMFPAYGFAGHKGYGAPLHIAAIKEHGVCPLHRRSFLSRIYDEMSTQTAQAR